MDSIRRTKKKPALDYRHWRKRGQQQNSSPGIARVKNPDFMSSCIWKKYKEYISGVPSRPM